MLDFIKKQKGKVSHILVYLLDRFSRTGGGAIKLAQELQRRWPTGPNGTIGTANIVRTDKSALYPDIPDELLVQTTQDAEHLRIARELHLRSQLVVPLIARGKTLGALTLVWAESDRRYSRDDVPLMEELGLRAGIAVDKAGRVVAAYADGCTGTCVTSTQVAANTRTAKATFARQVSGTGLFAQTG